MNKIISLSGLFILLGCVQDSPNIQQIENMQFFIDNKKNEEVIEIMRKMAKKVDLQNEHDNNYKKMSIFISDLMKIEVFR